jgi:hypothetical protein
MPTGRFYSIKGKFVKEVVMRPGVQEFRSGGVVEWWSGGVVEWWRRCQRWGYRTFFGIPKFRGF